MCTYLLTRDGVHDDDLTKRWTDVGETYVFYYFCVCSAHARFQGITRPAATTDGIDGRRSVARTRKIQTRREKSDGRTRTYGPTNVHTYTRTRSTLADDVQRTGAQHDTTNTVHVYPTISTTDPASPHHRQHGTATYMHIGGGCSGTV